MTTKRSKPNITEAASKLRNVIWSAKEGELLGSEEDIINMLKVSRPTVRQLARFLEAEGMLKVRRGINGGYFSARPSVEIVEASVSAYLHAVNADEEEVTEVASALWVISARRAAALNSDEKSELMETLRSRVLSLKDDAGFDEILSIEDESRAGIFKLIKSPYIELIFHVNRLFARRRFSPPGRAKDDTPEHLAYVTAWRKGKLLEIESIRDGDREISELAARLTRKLFHTRLYGRGRH